MSLLILKKRRGQASMVEYAVLFFIVAGAIAAMSTYASRVIQARVRGARNYMVAQVNGTYATYYPNRTTPVEYEPYYVATESDRSESSILTETHTPWAGHEGKYETTVDSTATTDVTSVTAPSLNAND